MFRFHCVPVDTRESLPRVACNWHSEAQTLTANTSAISMLSGISYVYQTPEVLLLIWFVFGKKIDVNVSSSLHLELERLCSVDDIRDGEGVELGPIPMGNSGCAVTLSASRRLSITETH